MKITDVIQRTPPWERWRAQGVTASEAAIILGRSPYKTPWRLWAERTGLAREADLSANPHVQRGNALEDDARRAFEERHDTMLLPLCGESEEHPVLRASFDGIADDGSPVELKVPAERTFAEVAEKTDGGARLPALLAAGPAPALCGRRRARLAGVLRGTAAPAGVSRRARRGVPERGAGARLSAVLGGGRQAQGAAARSGTGPLCPHRRGAGPLVGARRRIPGPAAGEGRPRCTPEGEQRGPGPGRGRAHRDDGRVPGGGGGWRESHPLPAERRHRLRQVALEELLLPELDPGVLETYRRKASERVRITPLDEETATIAFDGKAVDAAWQQAASESFFF